MTGWLGRRFAQTAGALAMVGGVAPYAFAQSIDTRFVSDPLFLPLRGQFYGSTVYTLDQPHGMNFKADVNTGSFDASNSDINQMVEYGLANRVAVRFAIGYATHSRDSTAAATGDVTTGNSSGFSDPSVSVTYRFLDQPRSPIILDMTAAYSPDVFASKSAGGGLDGTSGRGGQNTSLSFALGRVMRSFTAAGVLSTTYVGEQMTELLSNDTSLQSAAHWSYDASLETQTRFARRVSLNAGVGLTTTGNYVVSNAQKGTSHTYDGPSTLSVNLALNVQLRPNRVVASF